MIVPRWSPSTALLLALLALGSVSACGTQDTQVKCARTIVGRAEGPCMVRFDREGSSTATVLGREIELLNIRPDRVTLSVESAQITVSTDDSEAQEANLNIRVLSIGRKTVVVRFSEVDV
ncbi:hypothetical protein AB0C74_36085 [Spirillospora sp. NPDC048832]|jgi:hypothetical protein